MITRVHHNGVKTIALRLEALRQQLERILDEVDYDAECDFIKPEYGLLLEFMVDHDDLQALIHHMNETVYNVAKHLGVDGHAAHVS